MAGKNTTKRKAGGTTTQTVRIGGKRMRLTTRNGKVTAKPAPVLEWELQAAQVRALRNMGDIAPGGHEKAALRRGQRLLRAANDNLTAILQKVAA